MTNNQREFQKQINRLQREINSLIKRGVITTPPQLPKQPKRITKKKIDELKGLKGKHFVGEVPKSTHRKSKDSEQIHTRSKTEKPLKLKPAKGESPYVNPQLKGKRKKRKDFGTHLTAEEKAKRNAKRLATIAKKSRPTTPEYAQPQTSYPEYNMVEWILDRLTQAKSVVIETQPMRSYGKQATRHSRVSYLDSLIQLVASNLQAEDYYNTIANREQHISSHIDTIVYASDQDDVDNSFTELYTLLSPDPVSLDELKRISEEAENYNVENYNG